MHEFFTTHEGCWCSDAVVLPEQVFNELEVLHYPFDKDDINVDECVVYTGSRYLYDPADVVQRSIHENRYDKITFIDVIETLTFNQFQIFCKDVTWLMHDSYMSRCTATKIGVAIPAVIKEHKSYFWKITYPFTPKEEDVSPYLG